MHNFSEKTRQILTSAGWYEGSVFDTTEYELLLHSIGIVPSQATLDFLREFGDSSKLWPSVNPLNR